MYGCRLWLSRACTHWCVCGRFTCLDGLGGSACGYVSADVGTGGVEVRCSCGAGMCPTVGTCLDREAAECDELCVAGECCSWRLALGRPCSACERKVEEAGIMTQAFPGRLLEPCDKFGTG